MSKLYVVPVISEGGPRDYRDGSELDFDDFRSTIDRTVLLGDPGGGKSTLSNFLAAHWSGGAEGIVPFHVTLREYAAENKEQSIVQFIEHKLATRYQNPCPPGLIEALLLSGEAAVIFDGLDELIDTTKRRAVSAAVELFSVLYPLAKILITSRRVGYDQARLDPEIFDVRVIAGFDDEEVADYVHKWFSSQGDYGEEDAERLATSFISQSYSVRDLRSNPLMLALMCIIFRGENFIPRNRPAVYEKCATLLFEKWDGHRDIHVPLEARAHVDAAMKHVAYWMLLSDEDEAGVPYDRLVREMASYLRGRAFETTEDATRASTEFVDFCKGRAWVFSDAGTTAEGEHLFTFTHRTFMEYFAAFHLTRISDTPEKLAQTLLPRVAREEWDVVAQLAIQIVEKAVDLGSERALLVMLNEKRKRSSVGRTNVLAFVSRCSTFATVSPPFVRQLTEATLGLLLESFRENEGYQHMPFVPWWTLLRNGAGSHKAHQAPIADVHIKMLSEWLSEPGSPKWKAACLTIYMAQSLTWPWVVRGESSLGAWLSTFREITATKSSDLAMFARTHPAFITDAIVARVISPTEALAELRMGESSFSDMYFGTWDDEAFWKMPSLAHIMLFVAGNYSFGTSEADLSFVDELTEIFLNDFWTLERESTSGGAFRNEELAPPRLNAFGYIDAECPPRLQEAALLIGLARAEILENQGVTARSHHRQHNIVGRMAIARETDVDSFDVGELLALDIVPETHEFMVQWVHRKARVFDEVGQG
jgi:hypothetical protein